jgi:pyruvate,water dikinase
MNDQNTYLNKVIQDLRERAKELKSLYAVEEILLQYDKPLEQIIQEIVEVLPSGWQYPAYCRAKITVHGITAASSGFRDTPWIQKSPVEVRGEAVGSVSVCYTKQLPYAEDGPFLIEEGRLLESIAKRLGQAMLHRDLKLAFDELRSPDRAEADSEKADWRIILGLLKRTDPNLFKQISRKMLNYLAYNGIDEAKDLLLSLSSGRSARDLESPDENRPLTRASDQDLNAIAEKTFRIVAEYIPEDTMLSTIQVWIKEDRVNFLVEAVEKAGTSLVELANAMERYEHTGVKSSELSLATQVGVRTALIRRLLTDHLDFIARARRYLEIDDFSELLDHTILIPNSHGKLGGKSSGLFLASRIVLRAQENRDLQEPVRVPKSWFLPSDALLQFIAYNELDDLYNWKYRDIDQIRQEYPHILQVFKGSRFPPEIERGISAALDDFGDRPLIVRSSSLLEDRAGSAFSGKYKSLFLANQGGRESRLVALLDAITEVYASVFSPDPIQYRAERHLLDLQEEMGIIIQEVVGVRAGRYFLPAFAGVGFSSNEFRWSPRIKREDGLLRLVPGLGTRAVDRLADDYPVLVSPGQPKLRVNPSPEETARYSPRRIDVINLEANAFQTLEIRDLLREIGSDYPAIDQLVSIYDGDRLKAPAMLGLDPEREDVLFTFEGLITRTPFMTQMRNLLLLLCQALQTPVDIEFASDGKSLYLLQCRPQSFAQDSTPSAIPRDIPEGQLVFSANRHISNGRVPDITHIVYVDPEGYSGLGDLNQLRDVGRAVGQLNKILPKRKFILMGPGRWGSRGDIKLGVNVTYSDINNTAMLIEIARKQGNYVPDLSFGTHFFQDLVESSIRYLPLYPDDPGVAFQLSFFRQSPNILNRLLPGYDYLSDTLRVIDVPSTTEGRILRVLMNAEVEKAVAVLASPDSEEPPANFGSGPAARGCEDHARWRLRMAEKIAAELDPAQFGVKGFYLVGSTKNGTAGPNADIDVIIHFAGTPVMRASLEWWLDGWSRCLSEINFLRTGHQTAGLLDVRIVTDQDVSNRAGFAAKIGAVSDAARPLPLRAG